MSHNLQIGYHRVSYIKKDFSLYIVFISVVFTQLLSRTPNHFPLRRHWTCNRDFGPATAILDPRPRPLDPRPRPLDPRPATISQTPAFCTQPSYCMHSAFLGLRFTLTSWTSPLKFRPLMSSEKAFWRWRALVLKRPVFLVTKHWKPKV